jgi:hypothetical protein
VRADQSNDGVAPAYCVLDDLHEVDTGLDTVNVHEDLIAAEVVAQTIIEPAGLRCRLVGS